MEEVVDYMWNNDRSGVFDFNAEILIAIERKIMFIRFFVQVSSNESELGTPKKNQKENLELRLLLF